MTLPQIAEKPMSQVEKCARLMGMSFRVIGGRVYSSNREFNPLKNKADLMDLECALGIDVLWNDGAECVSARHRTHANRDLIGTKDTQYFSNHPDKFTARAHAVMAVVEQIYDGQFGVE